MDQMISILINRGLLPHNGINQRNNGINQRNGGKTAVYITLTIDKLELRFLDQMSTIQIQRGLKRSFTPK